MEKDKPRVTKDITELKKILEEKQKKAKQNELIKK
jgi:hypothetical protein